YRCGPECLLHPHRRGAPMIIRFTIIRFIASKFASIVIGSVALACALGPRAAQADERKQLAFETIDRNAAEMAALSDSIFFFGEPGMQELETTRLLKGTLEAAGFRVDLGGAGMPTNLWAEYGSGHPKIAIVTEADALPSGPPTPLAFD